MRGWNPHHFREFWNNTDKTLYQCFCWHESVFNKSGRWKHLKLISQHYMERLKEENGLKANGNLMDIRENANAIQLYFIKLT